MLDAGMAGSVAGGCGTAWPFTFSSIAEAMVDKDDGASFMRTIVGRGVGHPLSL